MSSWCSFLTPIYVPPSFARRLSCKQITSRRAPQVIVAMITSQLFRANHPSRVTVVHASPEGQQTGLLTDSVVMTDNLATIAESAIDRVIGT